MFSAAIVGDSALLTLNEGRLVAQLAEKLDALRIRQRVHIGHGLPLCGEFYIFFNRFELGGFD